MAPYKLKKYNQGFTKYFKVHALKPIFHFCMASHCLSFSNRAAEVHPTVIFVSRPHQGGNCLIQPYQHDDCLYHDSYLT
jgi:hypothetical protein